MNIISEPKRTIGNALSIAFKFFMLQKDDRGHLDKLKGKRAMENSRSKQFIRRREKYLLMIVKKDDILAIKSISK